MIGKTVSVSVEDNTISKNCWCYTSNVDKWEANHLHESAVIQQTVYYRYQNTTFLYEKIFHFAIWVIAILQIKNLWIQSIWIYSLCPKQ